jgi:hypothetical protein
VSLRLPEPDSFEDLLRPVRIEIALLVRLSRHPTSEPYWSTGVYRFDDSDPDRAGAFGIIDFFTHSDQSGLKKGQSLERISRWCAAFSSQSLDFLKSLAFKIGG